MKITFEDALSLLSKYADEHTRVLAVIGTPSVSMMRVSGAIRLLVTDGTPHLIVEQSDGDASDQIKFRLSESDCVFEYGDFRESIDEEHDDRFEAFLVIGSSKGDTLSLFEPKD